MAFREKIKYYRNKLKLTQPQFAKSLGVSIWTVRAWERGDTEASSTTRKKICGRLGIPEAELISPPPKPNDLASQIFIGKRTIPANIPDDMIDAINDVGLWPTYVSIHKAKKDRNTAAVEICTQVTNMPKDRTEAIKKVIFN